VGKGFAAHAAVAITVSLLFIPVTARAAVAAGRLRIVLVNEDVVPEAVVTRARAEVTRIYSQIGVEIVWIVGPDEGSRARVVKLTNWEPDDRSRSATALGVTVAGERSRRAYVIWPRVQNVARRSVVGLDAMLAVAIAHEIGHILLPHNAHGKRGLMRESWDANDLRLAAAGLLGFSRESAVKIARAMRSEVTIAERR
jgi:hypothetical protein